MSGSTRSRFLGVLFVLSLVAALVGWAGPASAGPLYWDNAFSAPLGSWDDGVTFNWSATLGGGVYTDSAWVGDSDAHFEGTAGVVTLSGTIASVGSISFDTDGYTLGDVVDNGTITLTGTGGNITTGAGLNTINSIIDGAVGLTKLGAGTLTLSGTNTYAGGTTISNGTLQFAKLVSMPASGAVAVNAGTTLAVNVGGAGEWTTGTSGNGTIGGLLAGLGGQSGGTVTYSGNVTLGLQITGTQTYSGIIGNVGSSLGLTKTGAGTLTLSSASSSYSGQLTIESGTLSTDSINNKNANGVLGNSALPVIMGATGQTGTLRILKDGSLSSNKDFTLANGGTGEFWFSNLSGGPTNQDRPLTLSGVIGGSGNFVKSGFAPISLSGNNNYSGTTTVSSGPLRLSSANALPGGIGATGGTSALTINGESTYGAVIELAYGNFLRGLGTGSDQFQIPGGISGFSARGAARQVIVNNDPSFELIWGISTFNPSVLQFGYTTSANNTLTLQNKIDLNGATRTITVINNTATLSGDIRNSSGTAGITKTGGGTLVLSGNNTYNGPITIIAGTLSVGAAANLGTGGNLIFDGGTLQVTSATALSLAGHAIVCNVGKVATFNVSGAGPLVLDAACSGPINISAGAVRLDDSGSVLPIAMLNYGVLTVNRSDTVTQGANFPSFISGTGSVANAGSGTLALNAPNYYKGTTAATAGTVKLSHNLAIQNSALDTTGAGFVTLDTGVTTPTFGGLAASGTARDLATVISSGYGSVTNLTLNPQSGSVTYGGVIDDGAAGMTLTKTGAGTQVLQGVNAYTGATILSAGTLELSGSGSILNSAVTFSGGGLKLTNTAAETGAGRVHDTNGITSNGGTLTYTNTSGGNNYAETIGSVALTSGQLDIVESTNQAGAGSQTLTLAGLTHTGATNTSAVTFSAASTGPQASGNKNMIEVTGGGSTNANEIIGPWATTGTAANAQTDYAIYTSNYVTSANIGPSDETTWTTASNAHTLSIAAKTASALTATRNIAALKESSTATSLSSATANGSPTFTIASGHSLAVGDPVVLGGTAPKYFSIGTVYYVASVTATTFTLAATPGGTAINAGDAQTPTFTGGLKLDSGINLGTTGILNAGTAAFGIGRTAAGGNVTLPTAGAGNLFVTAGSSGLNGRISIDAPIVDNDGALTLVKSGSGVLRLSGTNTYTGGTVINAGTLCVTNSVNLGAAGTSIIFNGSAALSCGPNANWAFASGGTPDLGSHPITLNNGAVAGLYYNSPNTTITVSGAITGSGGIIYGRDPVVTFSGGSGFENLNLLSTGNTFTGPLTLGLGTENIGTGGDFRFDSLADSTSPITLNLGGGGWNVSYGTGATANLSVPNRPINLLNSNATIRNQNGTYTMTLGAVSTSTTGAKTLNLGNGGAGGTVAGAITDGLGVISVTKSGTGTWTISGNNTYSGTTSITGGTLTILGSQAMSRNSKIYMTKSTTISLQTDDAGTVNFGSEVEVNASDTSSGVTSNYTIDVRNNGGATTGSTIVLGKIDFYEGGGNFASSRNIIVTGANDYRLQVGDVDMNVNSASTAAYGNQGFRPLSAPLTITGTVKQINGNAGNTTANKLYLGGTMGGNLVSGIIADADDYADSSNPNAQPLNVVKGESGDWTLSGNNTYTGTTTINAGLLRINGNQSSATGAVTVSGGALAGTGTLGGAVTLSGTGGIELRDGAVGTLTLNSDLNINGAAGKNNLYFDLGTGASGTDRILVGGNTTMTASGAGVITLNQLSGAKIDAATYDLIAGTGTMVSPSDFALATTAAFGNTFNLQLDGTSKILQVVVAAAATAPASVFWKGGTDTDWSTVDNWATDDTGGTAASGAPGYNTDVSVYATGATGLTTGVLDTDFDINSLTYTAGATANTTIGGTKTLTFEAASGTGITVNTPGSGTPTHTISATVGLASSQTWTVDSGAKLTVSGVVSDFGGGNSLTKDGAGTLTLSGLNTYSGATIIKGGALSIWHLSVGNVIVPNALGMSSADPANLVLNPGTTLNFALSGDSFKSTDRGFTINGTADGDSATLSNSGSGNRGVEFTSTASPAYGTPDQTRTLILSGTHAAGGTTKQFNFRLSANIADNGTGAVSLIKNGTGSWGLLGHSTYTGGTTINAGTLRMGVANALPAAGAVTLANVAGAVLDLTDSGQANYSQTIGSLSDGGSSGGNITLGSATLTVGDAASTSYAGAISGTGNLTKQGAGALTLSGANLYTGATSVTNGKLLLGQGGSMAATAVSVTGTATYGTAYASSDNNIAGGKSLSLAAGTTLDMRDANTNTLNFSGAFASDLSGASLYFDLDASGGDKLVLGGNATVTGNTFYFDALGDGSLITGTHAYTLIEAVGGGLSADGGFTIGNTLPNYTLTLDAKDDKVYLTVALSNVPGDTNDDKVVDAADFITLKQNFGGGVGGGAEVGNFDGIGAVDWADLSTLMSNFGATGGAPAVTPEPATLGLLAIGALAVLRRRRS